MVNILLYILAASSMMVIEADYDEERTDAPTTELYYYEEPEYIPTTMSEGLEETTNLLLTNAPTEEVSDPPTIINHGSVTAESHPVHMNVTVVHYPTATVAKTTQRVRTWRPPLPGPHKTKRTSNQKPKTEVTRLKPITVATKHIPRPLVTTRKPKTTTRTRKPQTTKRATRIGGTTKKIYKTTQLHGVHKKPIKDDELAALVEQVAEDGERAFQNSASRLKSASRSLTRHLKWLAFLVPLSVLIAYIIFVLIYRRRPPPSIGDSERSFRAFPTQPKRTLTISELKRRNWIRRAVPRTPNFEQLDRKQFKDKGPLVLTKELKGEVKFAECPPSKPIEQVEFDAGLNEIVGIGSHVEVLPKSAELSLDKTCPERSVQMPTATSERRGPSTRTIRSTPSPAARKSTAQNVHEEHTEDSDRDTETGPGTSNSKMEKIKSVNVVLPKNKNRKNSIYERSLAFGLFRSKKKPKPSDRDVAAGTDAKQKRKAKKGNSPHEQRTLTEHQTLAEQTTAMEQGTAMEQRSLIQQKTEMDQHTAMEQRTGVK